MWALSLSIAPPLPCHPPSLLMLFFPAAFVLVVQSFVLFSLSLPYTPSFPSLLSSISTLTYLRFFLFFRFFFLFFFFVLLFSSLLSSLSFPPSSSFPFPFPSLSFFLPHSCPTNNHIGFITLLLALTLTPSPRTQQHPTSRYPPSLFFPLPQSTHNDRKLINTKLYSSFPPLPKKNMSTP